MPVARPSRRRILAAGVVLALAASADPASHAAPTPDEAFIESIGRGAPDEPVDRRQLASMFSRVAAALEDGKLALVTVLSEAESLPPIPGTDPRLLRARFDAYDRNLTSFARQVHELDEEPNSRLVFYQVFISGQKTCWTLDLFGRLVEMRAADPERLQAQLPSREACARFRSAVFQPRVEAILREALVEQVYERRELGELRREVRELEQLVQDLIGSEPD